MSRAGRCIALFFLLTLASPAAALVDGDGDRYYVLNVNDINWDTSGADNARGVAFTFGQYLGDRRVASSETELGMTVADGTVEQDGLAGGSEQDWDLIHLGQFVSFQNTGDFRVQGRLGFAFLQQEVGNNTDQSFEAAYGISAMLGPAQIGLTQMGSDFRFLSLGFRF